MGLHPRLFMFFPIKVSGATLAGTHINPDPAGLAAMHETFTGKKSQPLPPAPDLSKVKFGKPIELFNGKDLKGWMLTDPHAKNGWSAAKGELINDVMGKEAQPDAHYGNLRTEQEFEDFNLKLDANVPPNCDSGVFLRGIYEVQVADSYDKPVGMGGILCQIWPTRSAEKPVGEWQTINMTLLDRHVTVTTARPLSTTSR